MMKQGLCVSCVLISVLALSAATAGELDPKLRDLLIPPPGLKPLANFSHERLRFEEVYTIENHIKAIAEIRRGGVAEELRPENTRSWVQVSGAGQ